MISQAAELLPERSDVTLQGKFGDEREREREYARENVHAKEGDREITDRVRDRADKSRDRLRGFRLDMAFDKQRDGRDSDRGLLRRERVRLPRVTYICFMYGDS